jgi:PAS domain S-box-containing protein
MSERSLGTPNVVPLAQAAEMLQLPVQAVEALVGAGYLAPLRSGSADGEIAFPLGDIKAFVARNADNGSGNLFFEEGAADPAMLLEALDGRSEEMGRKALEIFASVFPEAKSWSERERRTFVDQARNRFEAILAVTSQGVEVDEALVGDLQEVGGAAAWSGSPLPQLLIVLRISRDLVVQTAVELAEERGRHWALALSLLLTRVLPAMDRLTDALAQGYWNAVIGREAEQKSRYEHVVEHSSDGVYEVDLDGRIQYANPSLAIILGRSREHLEGARIHDVLLPTDPSRSLEVLTNEPVDGAESIDLPVIRPDGVRRLLEIRATARWRDGELVGFQGVVRDMTTLRDLEADKNEFLALMTSDLRQPLTTILGLGATLETHGEALTAERVRGIGSSVRMQAERISRLADDLHDISRLDAASLLLSPRPVDLHRAVGHALAILGEPEGVVAEIPAGLEVVADARRLEQVVANLVENALLHGSKPVHVRVVNSSGSGGRVEISVQDNGTGVPEALVPSLFNRVRLLARGDRDRSRGTGLGLSLVKGLVEAMGGQVWYVHRDGAGADFHFTVPLPRNASVAERPA